VILTIELKRVIYTILNLIFINVYLNDEDVRFIGSLDALISSGDNLTILPAVAGGS
jgi:molybdopterin converting factor small subunit